MIVVSRHNSKEILNETLKEVYTISVSTHFAVRLKSIPARVHFSKHKISGRARWQPTVLIYTVLLACFSPGHTLKDRFAEARKCITAMYPTRRRVGQTYQGFIKQLLSLGNILLTPVMEHLRRRLREISAEHWTRGGFLAFAVDGSRVELPRTEDNEKVFGCGGRKGTGPQAWLTALWHVGTGLPWAWLIGKANDAERNHLRDMLHMLPEKALLIADAGFTGYDLMNKILLCNRSFLIRVGSNVTLLKNLGYAKIENDGTVYLWPVKAQDKAQPPLVLRLITLQRHGRKMYLLTNLDEEKLDTRQAAFFYELRWGVEVFFRSLKQTLCRRKMLSRAPMQARAELAWTMIGLQLLGLLSVAAIIRAKHDPLSWSVAMSLRAVRNSMQNRQPAEKSRNLFVAFSHCVKDDYARRGGKKARNWPHKKKESPPGSPKFRNANETELAIIKEISKMKPAA
jgi:hypothetical protein